MKQITLDRRGLREAQLNENGIMSIILAKKEIPKQIKVQIFEEVETKIFTFELERMDDNKRAKSIIFLARNEGKTKN